MMPMVMMVVQAKKKKSKKSKLDEAPRIGQANNGWPDGSRNTRVSTVECVAWRTRYKSQ